MRNFAIFLLVFCGNTFAAGTMDCRVVGIADGDTLTALCPSNQQVKVRLAQIDAPEKAQPFGERSRQSLASLCHGKSVRLDKTGADRYGRTVAQVTCASIDVNAEQVKTGMAWAYPKYVTDPQLYKLQKSAQEARAGLWADPSPTPPWEWRKRPKNARQPPSK